MTLQEIKKFTVSQFQGVRATVEFTPRGPGCIIIAGPNGAGKSSVVNGIYQLFDPAGVKGKDAVTKPINDKADSSFIQMSTTDLIARVDFKKNGAGTLTVKAHDGAKYGSPAAFMKESTGGQVFDTEAFSDMDAKDQRAELLRRIELPFDLDALDAERKRTFDGRTDVNREVGKLESQLAAFAPVDESLPIEEQSASALMRELEEIREHNAQGDTLHRSASSTQTARENAEADVARLIEELDAARTFLSRAQEAEALTLDAYKSFERKDDTDLRASLDGIDALNAKIRAQAHRGIVADELAAQSALSAQATAKLAEIDKRKADALKAAVFPVKGLGIDDTGITFDTGREIVPFKQVNTGMKIVIAFDLFTQGKPDLRIIFIKNGDMLDAVSLAGIEKLAIERGYYVVIERDRDESREIGWTIVDGELAS
ncbi:AAA family ATPase [Glaciibacter psychrotolerans]|uniref:Rad50/SbcC-type AAA domain-containing protein n=1 Tax=Glaciibacter psychrotolerans TaxID=670054 RepID=A0A7Z0J5R4_9MICO|nr:AAA family ATPase [Leifsonia psychrotolerans]NYJ19159.1 hypothetical protein [Leifsonia psychrotolerans]